MKITAPGVETVIVTPIGTATDGHPILDEQSVEIAERLDAIYRAYEGSNDA